MPQSGIEAPAVVKEYSVRGFEGQPYENAR
jgi:hypothetical protein